MLDSFASSTPRPLIADRDLELVINARQRHRHPLAVAGKAQRITHDVIHRSPHQLRIAPLTVYSTSDSACSTISTPGTCAS